MSEERAPSGERGRWSTRRKTEVVLRALRGKDLDGLSRELGVTAGTLAQWRQEFLVGGQAAAKSRPADERDDALRALLHDVLHTKPERHTINDLHFIRPERTMSQIGG